MSKAAGGVQTQLPGSSDQCLPEGAQAININSMEFDGTGTITYTFTTDSLTFKKPSTIRTLYFDARNISEDVLFAVLNGPTLRLPAGKQGYVPLFMPCPMQGQFTSESGNGPIVVSLYNFKIMPIIW